MGDFADDGGNERLRDDQSGGEHQRVAYDTDYEVLTEECGVERTRPAQARRVVNGSKVDACGKPMLLMSTTWGQPLSPCTASAKAGSSARASSNSPSSRYPANGCGIAGHPLGKGDHVGDDAVALGGKGMAEPPEAGDHLVEDEEDAVGG